MPLAPPVSLYWSGDDREELRLNVGRFTYPWAAIVESYEGVYVVLNGWSRWPLPYREDARMSLRCHDAEEARRVAEALAAIRGFVVEAIP